MFQIGLQGSNSSFHTFKDDKLEPIVVIGFSLKFPQSAKSPDAFWSMLSKGRSAMSDVPGDRFNIEAFYHPNTERLDTVSLQTLALSKPPSLALLTVPLIQLNDRGGHFLSEDMAAFDAPFFSLPPIIIVTRKDY